jgi:hypothetical protein
MNLEQVTEAGLAARLSSTTSDAALASLDLARKVISLTQHMWLVILPSAAS